MQQDQIRPSERTRLMSQTERKPKPEFQIKIQWFLLIDIGNRTSIIKIVAHSRLHIQTYH